MTTPDPKNNEVEPGVASSRFKITKEGIESKQSVPGEHTPWLLVSVVLTICVVMAVVAPSLTLEVAPRGMSPKLIGLIIVIQEMVIVIIAITAWACRMRQRA